MDVNATFEPIHRRPARGGDEVDAFSRVARRHSKYRAGEVHQIKQRAQRRTRHQVRQALRTAVAA